MGSIVFVTILNDLSLGDFDSPETCAFIVMGGWLGRILAYAVPT